jgi:SAM-dependent methyltransferase
LWIYVLNTQQTFLQQHREHWGRVAKSPRCLKANGYYHRRLARIYRHLIPPGGRVLEVGCGDGSLLAAVNPAYGVGVDVSEEMIHRARAEYPELRFVVADAHALALGETFDAIILSDVVNDLWDVQAALEQLRPLTHDRTRIILNFFSRLWELPLRAARALRLATPLLDQNWLTPEDVRGLLMLAGFESIRGWNEILWPVTTPGIDVLMNRYVARLWPFPKLALTNFIVARPAADAKPQAAQPPPPGLLPGGGDQTPSVSVVVPARNEAGNIAAIFARTAEIGRGTELIFVEGHSSDDTYAAIEREIAANPGRRCKLLRQTGKGKGDAVRLGFEQATGEVLMILDADLTVPPEDLPRFYEAVASGRAEFANGVRLVYPMEAQAMRFLNLLGNKFFSLAFSWLLGQPIKDTLCGSKVLRRSDYQRIAANRAYFGDFDPFGDFDLIFGAAKLNLKIVDVPIRYRMRTYGATNIQRFRHGLLLLRMTAFAARRIKFV